MFDDAIVVIETISLDRQSKEGVSPLGRMRFGFSEHIGFTSFR